MGVIEVVKKGFAIANQSKNLVLVLFGFSFLWNIVSLAARPENAEAATITPALGAIAILFILASIFVQAGSLGFIKEMVKKGQANINDFVASGKTYYLRLLGVGFIVSLFIMILVILAAVVVVAGGGDPNVISLAIGAVLGMLALVGSVLVFFSPYIVVVDNARVIPAIQTSIQVVKAHFWSVVLIGLLLISIGFLVGLVLGLLMGFLTNILAGAPGQLISGFLSSFVNAYLGVITTGAFMTFYLSLQGESQASIPEPPAE